MCRVLSLRFIAAFMCLKSVSIFYSEFVDNPALILERREEIWGSPTHYMMRFIFRKVAIERFVFSRHPLSRSTTSASGDSTFVMFSSHL